MFALDTNTAIYLFKDAGNVRENLKKTSPGEVTLPVVAYYELEVGALKSREPAIRHQHLETLLQVVRLLSFGMAEAKAAAEIRADLERRGEKIGPLDVLIAATAVSHGATLATRASSDGLLDFRWWTGTSSEIYSARNSSTRWYTSRRGSSYRSATMSRTCLTLSPSCSRRRIARSTNSCDAATFSPPATTTVSSP